MAITVKSIVAKLTLVAVSVDPLIIKQVNKEAELEKLIESSDSDLEVVIYFGSFCPITTPDNFLSAGISTANVVADEPIYRVSIGTLQHNETVVAGSCIHCLYSTDKTIFCFKQANSYAFVVN